MSDNNNTSRGFSSNIGAILAAAGGAVGLGNVWRFPYMLGNNGGGAFLLVYVFFVLLIGIPIMVSEFVIGRRSQRNVIGAYRKLSGKKFWVLIGFFALVAAILVYSFYSVVAGWTLNYVVLSSTGKLNGLSAPQIADVFTDFSQGTMMPLLYQVLFLAITAVVISFGVQKGIEKISKILMPLLFIILILMCVRSVSLPNSLSGLSFLFKPDFSKITWNTLLSAMGQSFFSLSLGVGAMITYGSYIRKQDSLVKTSAWISVCDLLVAVLSGIVIIPAVFAFGLSPAAGPELVYVVLPNVFNSMPLGGFFAILFFLLLSIAALTSTISLHEIVVACFVEELKMKRTAASVLCSVCIFAIGSLCALSFGPLNHVRVFGYTIFGLFDLVSASYIMPTGALLMVIFLGWRYPKEEVIDEVSNGGTIKSKVIDVYYFVLRYIAPIALLTIIIFGIVSK